MIIQTQFAHTHAHVWSLWYRWAHENKRRAFAHPFYDFVLMTFLTFYVIYSCNVFGQKNWPTFDLSWVLTFSHVLTWPQQIYMTSSTINKKRKISQGYINLTLAIRHACFNNSWLIYLVKNVSDFTLSKFLSKGSYTCLFLKRCVVSQLNIPQCLLFLKKSF